MFDLHANRFDVTGAAYPSQQIRSGRCQPIVSHGRQHEPLGILNHPVDSGVEPKMRELTQGQKSPKNGSIYEALPCANARGSG